MTLICDTEGDIDSTLENLPGDELLVRIVNRALGGATAPAKDPTGGEEAARKAEKVAEQLDALSLTRIHKVTELYDNNYRNLLLFLTIIAPECLLDCILISDMWHR